MNVQVYAWNNNPQELNFKEKSQRVHFLMLCICVPLVSNLRLSYGIFILSSPWSFVNCTVLEHVSPCKLARALNNNSAPKPVCECGWAVVILTSYGCLVEKI